MDDVTKPMRLSVIGLLMACCALVAAEEPADTGSPVAASLLRVTTKTLGGEQFWADEFIHGGWRIQRNVFSGHYRLLDDDDCRRAVGDYAACRSRFEELRVAEAIPPRKPKAVVILHGLIRSRDSMRPLAEYLTEHGDYEVVNVSYPSTRASVSDHAASLAKVLENLEGVEEVNFAAHSLGNLVIRHWLHDCYQPQAQAGTAKFKLGRFVMLGPPNNGAEIARTFHDNRLFGLLTGKSGKQLSGGWEELTAHLCVPPCEFGVIAGDSPLSNPLITGSDDLIVGVEETKLAGAADFRVLPLHHGDIRDSELVGEMTLRFLEHGYFESEAERVPLR